MTKNEREHKFSVQTRWKIINNTYEQYQGSQDLPLDILFSRNDCMCYSLPVVMVNSESVNESINRIEPPSENSKASA